MWTTREKKVVSRRNFTRSIAALAATPLLPTRKSDGVSDASTATLAGVGLTGQQEDAISPEAEALAEIVRLRYGNELSAEQMEAVKRSLNNRVQAAARLNQYKLENGNEPAFVFSASID